MKEFFVALSMGIFIFVLCVLTTYARSKGMAALISAFVFFGFVAFVLAVVVYETILDYKRINKIKK